MVVMEMKLLVSCGSQGLFGVVLDGTGRVKVWFGVR